MDPVSGMLLGGAALGGLNAALGVAGNAISAAEQYHYAKKMYKHRYQWAMQDMRKAGLNPVLAANGGSVAGMGAAPSPDYGGAMTGGLSAGLNAARAVSDVDKTVSEAKLSDAQADLTHSKKIEQDVKNDFLPVQARALAEKAMFDASIANSASVMKKAQAELAGENAWLDLSNKRLRNENLGKSAEAKLWDIWEKQRRYDIAPKGKEGVYFDRADRFSKLFARGAGALLNSAKIVHRFGRMKSGW